MKTTFAAKLFLASATALTLSAPLALQAEDVQPSTAKTIWNKVSGAVGGTLEGVGRTATSIGEQLVGSKSPAEARGEIDARAERGLNTLLAKSASARILHEKAYAYAIFDTRKFSFLVTTGGGAGVAVDRQSGARTYMSMFTGGAGLGIGMQFYQVIFFFENQASLQRFITQGWEANAAATAVFGADSLEKNARFVEGMAVYQMNEAGIMADLNITGTRYWKSETLNK